MLRVNLCFMENGVMLVLYYAYNHAIEDLVSPGCMRVYLSKLSTCQRVVAIIKFGDVSSQVLRNDKLTTRVNFLISIRSEDQIITDDQ